MTDFTPQLAEAVQRLKDVLRVVGPLIDKPRPTDTPSRRDLFAFHAPVIDERLGPWASDEPLGLKKLIESVQLHLGQLEDALRSSVSPKDDPLPNVLGTTTFLKQLLIAPVPIVAVKLMMRSQSDTPEKLANGKYKSYRRREESERDAGFVDIIAAGGEEWIRIYSKKISHLLSEFREQDSYCNSDFDSDSDSDSDLYSKPKGDGASGSQPPPLRNSLLSLVDNLIEVAKSCERPPGRSPPRLTLRLARIDEFPEGGYEDERIPATIQAIRDRGVNVVFGDLSDIPLQLPTEPWTKKPCPPSRRINLDPTALLGLCSDLLHHPLPADEEGARKRFFRPQEHLMPGREGRDGNEGTGTWKGQSQNSRDLVKGTLDEMSKPLIEEIRDTLDALGEDIEFWATEATVQHINEALGSPDIVGDGLEQRRMKRMLGVESGDFFEGSRYEGREGCLKGFKVNVFPADPTKDQDESTVSNGFETHTTDGDDSSHRPEITTFHQTLAATCTRFLHEYYVSLEQPDSKEAQALPSFLQQRKLPIAKVAQLSKPFPIVSLGSFARGSAEGMTTLCMGNITFRDLWHQSRWKPRGWHQGSYELEKQSGERGNAAVWLLPYRCMGEGKRVKFEKGDFSYPTPT